MLPPEPGSSLEAGYCRGPETVNRRVRVSIEEVEEEGRRRLMMFYGGTDSIRHRFLVNRGNRAEDINC